MFLFFFLPGFVWSSVKSIGTHNEGLGYENGLVYNVDHCRRWHLYNRPQPRYTRLLLMFSRKYTTTDGPSGRYVVRSRP